MTQEKDKTQLGIELGVCILMVIGVACYVVLRARFAPHAARRAAARAGVTAIGTALKTYAADTGSYPTHTEGLGVLVTNPGVTGWAGPYVSILPADPWGTPYHYTTSAVGPSVSSAGPDGVVGTGDDIL